MKLKALKFKKPNLTLKLRMAAVVGILVAMLLAGAAMGLFALARSNSAVRKGYEVNLLPLSRSSKIARASLREFIALSEAVVHIKDKSIVQQKIKEVRGIEADNADRMKELAKVPMKPAMAKKFKIFKASYSDVRDSVSDVISGLNSKDPGTRATLYSEVLPNLMIVQSEMNKLIDLQRADSKTRYDKELKEASLVRGLVIGGLAIGLAIALLLAVLMVRSIMRGLRDAINLASEIADGRLGNDIDDTRKDELGDLLTAFRRMDERLSRIVSDVRSGSEAVGTAAAQISRGNDDLSQRTQEQASSLEETASSMEEMTSTVKQNADNASHANQLAQGAREQAERGGEVATQAITAMGEINESSRKIVDIVGLIDEIAFQTNLLSLNAAVEAARAGEQGRGFAVVATEVRNLAQRSAAAAKEIKGLINDSAEKVKVGSELTEATGKTLAEIVDSVKKVTDIVAEIAAASHEQSSGIEQVNNAVTQMDDVTQQNAALVEEAAAAARSMHERANELLEQVAFFRFDDSVVQVAQPAVDTSPAKAIESKAVEAATRQSSAARTAKNADAAHKKAASDNSVWEEF